LILSPTRELALQIAKECDSVTSQLRPRPKCHTAYGGTSKERELKNFFNEDPKIVVATPGRLNDYLSDPEIAQRFSDLRTLVLDEADVMLDSGFLPAIIQILGRLPPKSKGWQGMCFSATIPDKIENFLPKVLVRHHIRLATVDPNEVPTIDLVQQHSIVVPGVGDVFTTLYALLRKEQQLSPNHFKVIVFGSTANGVALMASLLSNLFNDSSFTSPQIFQLQSRLSQNVRTRTTNEFKEASQGIMLASDVIGRGMDFPNVGLVIQVGLPMNSDQYVHRVGRTARAGSEGRAIILLTQRESFFLKTNKQFPITTYPHAADLAALQEAESSNVEHAFDQIDEATKAKAYQGWLGFHKAFTNKLGLKNETLVQEANEYSEAIGCPEPPMIDKRVVGKMGLKGVRGLNVGLVVKDGTGRPQPKAAGSASNQSRPRRVSNDDRVSKPTSEGPGRKRKGKKK
jgi:ATP-dependent RNA helicase MSS116, mitochondrial